jgi:hypothetical protein
MAQENQPQAAPTSPLRRALLNLAYHPRIPEGAYLVAISVVVGLATVLTGGFPLRRVEKHLR